MKNGVYTGDLTDEQIQAIQAIYANGGVEVLKDSLSGYVLTSFQTMLPSAAYIAKEYFIGADTGLGKSLMMSLYLNIHKIKGTLGPTQKALVITTTSSIDQIKSTIEKSTGIKVFKISGDAKQIHKQLLHPDFKSSEVYIVSNSVFGSSVEFARVLSYMVTSFKTLVIDEAMIVANDTSNTSMSLTAWARHFEYKLGLNATIIEKSLEQAYNQMTLIAPNLLPSIDSLKGKYEMWSKPSRGKRSTFQGFRNLDQFLNSFPYHFYNVDRKDVGIEFNTEDIIVPLYMTPLQKEVQHGKNYIYALFSPTTQTDTSIIPFDRRNIPALSELIRIVRQEREIAKGGIVIYAGPTACKPLIEAELRAEFEGITVGIIDGSETDSREDLRVGFNEGKIDVLIINIPEALDLVSGRVMIFWTIPSKHYQARNRIARGLVKRDEVLRYYYLVYLNSHQSDYIRGTLLKDEITLTQSLGRTLGTARYLVKELNRLENKK